MNTSHDIMKRADEISEKQNWEPVSFEEFVEKMIETPEITSQAAKYVLDAIEYFGTREVVEAGETLERYLFFDDPANNGEHAILGNTKELNEIVGTIRSIASGTGKYEKLIWVHGPTATGKSEFKRCLINGLKEYSKTEEGARYTIEWNKSGQDSNYDPTYGGPVQVSYDWEKSPVQSSPFSVLPETLQEELIRNWSTEKYTLDPQRELDPFSKEVFTLLENKKSEDSSEDIFSSIVADENIRVRRYKVDKGTGIGVLSPDDGGKPKQKLVGNWMPSQLQRIDSSGKKNPIAFSYSGLFSQGNGGISIIEDAVQHSQLLQKLLLALDEDEVKLDHGTEMEIDTLLMIISNPDLEELLNQNTKLNEADPLKALKRRIEKHNFNYLLNLSLESSLLRKEVSNHRNINPYEHNETSAFTVFHESKYDENSTELAPYSIYTAALYNVLSRLENDDSNDLTPIEKVRLYDNGYLYKNDERMTMDDFEFNTQVEGRRGIPVTHTRDLLSDLIISDSDESQFSNVDGVLIPQEIAYELADSFDEAPVFDDSEADKFRNLRTTVLGHVEELQLQDVLDSALKDAKPDESEIETYVDEVFVWDSNPEEADNYMMKIFETQNLGWFDEEDYSSQTAKPKKKNIKEFRKQKIIQPFSNLWVERDDEYTVQDVDYSQLDVFEKLLSEYEVDDLKRVHPEFSPFDWNNPAEDTSTSKVKEKTIENMVNNLGYTEQSAKATARIIMKKVREQWE